jgi:hypothetical protein
MAHVYIPEFHRESRDSASFGRRPRQLNGHVPFRDRGDSHNIRLEDSSSMSHAASGQTPRTNGVPPPDIDRNHRIQAHLSDSRVIHTDRPTSAHGGLRVNSRRSRVAPGPGDEPMAGGGVIPGNGASFSWSVRRAYDRSWAIWPF